MTKEKQLELINKAIGNLKDNEDGYGQTPIDFMRKNGVKSTANMTIFLDSVGAYLEELRQGILADIETESAKKNGKASVLSAVKKLSKDAYTTNSNSRPYLAYAHYEAEDNVYWITSGCWMLIAENADGMQLCPESVKPFNDFSYKKYIPDTYNMQPYELPPVGKISAYLKQAKTKTTKFQKNKSEWVFFDHFACNGIYLEMLMRVTGSQTIYYKDDMHSLYIEGNGYKAVLCPIKRKDEEGNITPPTDFENI